MQLDIVHIGTAGSWAAIDSLATIFDDLFTPFGGNDRYFACNVGSEFFQRRPNYWYVSSDNTLIKLTLKNPIVSCAV